MMISWLELGIGIEKDELKILNLFKFAGKANFPKCKSRRTLETQSTIYLV